MLSRQSQHEATKKVGVFNKEYPTPQLIDNGVQVHLINQQNSDLKQVILLQFYQFAIYINIQIQNKFQKNIRQQKRSEYRAKMTTIEQILQQQDNYSQLSINASFTLQDILQEPKDEDLQIYKNIDDIQNIDAMFDDQMFSHQDKQNNNQEEIEGGETNADALTEKVQDKISGSKKQAELSASQKSQPKILSGSSIRRGTKFQDLPLPSADQIHNMPYTALKNVSQLFEISNSQIKGVGVPTCISTSGNRFLAIGTSIGNVVIFEVGVKDFRTLSRADQNKYGQVTSISVSRDNCYLVTGYETGLVILWDLYNFKLVKTILLHKNRILKVLFCGENYQNFVTSDSEGYLYMCTIQSYLWTGVKSQLLVDKTPNVYYDIKYSKIKNGKQILVLATYNSVLLISLKPTVSIIGSIERPEGINKNKIPNCEIGDGQDTNKQQRNEKKGIANKNINKNKQDYVCVSWGKLIYVYKFVYEELANQKIQLDFIMQQNSGIHNMQFINGGVLVTLDSRQVYRVINLLSVKMKVSDDTKVVPCEYINERQLEAQTIYQRYLKDKEGKFIKSYTNTIVSCSYNPKDKQIFLIGKNAVFRGRLYKWTDYARYLLTEEKNWQLTLKLCVGLYKGKYNIFAEPFIINKTTINLLCEIGDTYFKEKMKELELLRNESVSIKQMLNEVKQLFQMTIQYFSMINCEEYMFGTVYKNLKQNFFYAYEPQFIGSLEPYIEQSLINKIDNREVFNRIVEYYSDKPQLINSFIIALSEDSLYFSDIVEICTRQKLFESLCYICSINGDFISPANKIINHLESNSNDKTQYSYLKNYLNKLIQLKYPNDKPIIERKNEMLMDLSIWLGCKQTLQYMIKNYSDDYIDMMERLCKKLLEFDLLNEIPSLAENVIEKLDLIREEKLSVKYIDFLIQIGLSEKIHFPQELLKKILDQCVEICGDQSVTDFRKQVKYINILRFLQKYLLDQRANIKQIKQEYEIKLLPKLNVWVRLTYKMLAEMDRESILKQSPQLLKNDDPGRDDSIGYLFKYADKYKHIVNKYEDLIIQWSPQQSLIYILQAKGNAGIKQINTNIMKIADEKLKYAIIRKILRVLRSRNKQLVVVAKVGNQQPKQITNASVGSQRGSASQKSIGDKVESSLSNEVLLFYISSICKYKKQKRVFYELIQNQEEYKAILSELQAVIQKYGYRSCMGYIYEQQERYTDAFTQFSAVYTEYFNLNFTKLVNHEYSPGRFMGKIFHVLLDLCLKIKKQQQWGSLISVVFCLLQKRDVLNRNEKIKVIDTIQKIYDIKSGKKHPFLLQLIDEIEQTLTTMSRQVSIGLLGIQLNKYTDLLNRPFVANCLTSTLKGCRKRVEIFQISKKLMVCEFVGQFNSFFQINKINGCSSDNICDQCGLQANDRTCNTNVQQIIFEVLKCGHSYHEKCFKMNYNKCKICCRKQYGDQEQEQDKKRNEKKSRIVTKDSQDVGKTPNEGQRSEEVYRYLAFEDYIRREEDEFQSFRLQYEGYITAYKEKS